MAYAGLLIYALLFFVRPQEWVGWMMGWPLVDGVMAITLVTWIASLQNTGWKLKDAPQNSLVLGFFLATITSHLIDFSPFWTAAQGAFTGFGKVVIAYFLVASLLSSTKRVRVFLVVSGVGMLFMSFHAILQIANGYGFGGPELERGLPSIEHGIIRARAFGVFNDPNDLALILVASVPFFLRAVINRDAAFPKRALAACCLVPVGVAIYLTKSRGGWLSLGVMCAAFAALNLSHRIGKKVAIGFGLVLLLAVILLAPGRMGQYDAGDASSRGRWALWGEGLHKFRQEPFFGIGYNRFKEESESHLVAHNSYIHCLAELGLFGYFFFVALILASLRDGYLLARRNPGDNAEANALTDLSRAAVPALLGYLAACFFLSRTYVHPLYMFFGLFAALRGIHQNEELPAEGLFHTKKSMKRIVAIELASIAFIWLFTKIMWGRI